MDTPIDLYQVMAGLPVQWRPHLVSPLDDYVVRVAKVSGDHFWHAHDNTDELFLVLDGELRLGVRDEAGERVLTLGRGQMYVVPKDIEHKPFAPDGADILIIANRQLSRPTS